MVSSQPQTSAALPEGKEPHYLLHRGLGGPIVGIDAYEESKPIISGVNRTPDPPSRSIVTIQNRQFRLPINFKTIFQNFLPPNTGVKTCFNYKLNAQFLYSITIYRVFHELWTLLQQVIS